MTSSPLSSEPRHAPTNPERGWLSLAGRGSRSGRLTNSNGSCAAGSRSQDRSSVDGKVTKATMQVTEAAREGPRQADTMAPPARRPVDDQMRHALRAQGVGHRMTAAARIELVAVEQEHHDPRTLHALDQAQQFVAVARRAQRIVGHLAEGGGRGGDHRLGEIRHRGDAGQRDPRAGALAGQHDAGIALGAQLARGADQRPGRSGDGIALRRTVEAEDVVAGVTQQSHEDGRRGIRLAGRFTRVVPDHGSDRTPRTELRRVPAIGHQHGLSASMGRDAGEHDRRQPTPDSARHPPRLRSVSERSFASRD
jgi:hypothetical protein